MLETIVNGPFSRDYFLTVIREQQTEAFRLMEIYQKWFYEHVMPPSEDGYSSTVMVLPWTTGEPDYRDTCRDGLQKFTGDGFFFYNAGPYAEVPELIIPGKYSKSCVLFSLSPSVTLSG